MKRLHVFPFGGELAAGGRRPLLLFVAGLLALSWSALATAVWAENRSIVPEPVAAPEGTPETDSPHWIDPKLPTSHKRTAVATSQEEDAELSEPDPGPPRNHKRPAVARPQAVDEDPTADESYADEDDDACESRGRCADRCWAPGLCWQAFANRLEARGEWLLWWGKGEHVPALVTSGPSAPTSGQPGAIGSTGTVILFGNSELNDTARSGGRVTLDYWLTCDHTVGLEAQYFGLGDATANFQADSNTFPVLARPYFNATTGAADSKLIASSGTQTGSITVAATTSFQGAEALLRQAWCHDCDAHFDFLVGYRYLRLSDNLNINELDTFNNQQGPVPVGSTLALSDQFSTLNEFQGAELGFTSDWQYNRWNLEFLLKVGLGNTTSRVTINGSSVSTEPTQASVTSANGFLAQASNIGSYEHGQFTMVPELGINLGFDLTQRLRLLGGYSLIYWSAVARSGDQIDLNLTYPPVAGIRAPEFRFAMSDYWAQGLNLGLDFRF
jgi:hypothetical protein